MPTNPYGETKLAVERALALVPPRATGIRYVALRYFNAAGAHPERRHRRGPRQPETHLIPRLILRAMLRSGPPTPIFGEDYPTTDGTCVRDYVHVRRPRRGARAGARRAGARRRSRPEAFNLGNGEGFSVREVVDDGRRG